MEVIVSGTIVFLYYSYNQYYRLKNCLFILIFGRFLLKSDTFLTNNTISGGQVLIQASNLPSLEDKEFEKFAQLATNWALSTCESCSAIISLYSNQIPKLIKAYSQIMSEEIGTVPLSCRRNNKRLSWLLHRIGFDQIRFFAITSFFRHREAKNVFN